MITASVICAIGCAVADKLFPHIPAVERFIEGLPLGREGMMERKKLRWPRRREKR